MRYKVLEAFKVKTSQGEIQLQPGQVITLPHNKAVRLRDEGKIKPFCFWLRELVDTCQEPCSEAEGMKTTRECPHFTIFWEGRFKELIGGSK
jgi:hypothetical protein